MVGSVGPDLDRPRMIAVEHDRLAPGDVRGARHPARAGRQHVLAEAGGMDERVRERLHRQRRQGPIDGRHPGQVGVVQADDGLPDRSLRAELVGGRVGSNGRPVRDPELVVGGGPEARLGGRDLGVARVAQGDLEDRQVLATGGGRPLLDPHPQRLEAELGIAREREQGVDVGQPRGRLASSGRWRPSTGTGRLAARSHRRVEDIGGIVAPWTWGGRLTRVEVGSIYRMTIYHQRSYPWIAG